MAKKFFFGREDIIWDVFNRDSLKKSMIPLTNRISNVEQIV